MPLFAHSMVTFSSSPVLPGGKLDARFLIMVRGGGKYIAADRSQRLNMGTHVRVQAGGDFTATGVLFRERNNTMRSFIMEVENTLRLQTRYLNFNLGQYLTVIGGNLFLQGCFLLRVRPYGTGYLTTFSLGREVLVIAGNAVFTGVYNIGHYLFASYPWMSGKHVCVLGGTMTMIGGASVHTSGPQLHFGIGIDLAVMGGVMVTIGFSYGAAIAALLRVCGGQLTVGAGTAYHTGLTYARAYIVFAGFGAGQTFVVGAGNMQFIGGAYGSFINNAIWAGVGGNTMVGAGSLTWIGVPQARFYGTNNIYGLGGIYYNGAGSTTFIYLPQYSSYIAYYMSGIGTDTFIGAGWLTSIQNVRASFAVVYSFSGLGTEMYVGAGGAIFIRSYTYSKRLKYWTTWPYKYTVGGFGISPKQLKNDTAYIITKNAYTNIQYDKATGIWKKKIEARVFNKTKRALPGEGERSFSARRPMRQRQNRYQRSLMEASNWLTDAVSTLGSLARNKLGESSIILVDSSMSEASGTGPIPSSFFSPDLKGSKDPYAMVSSMEDPDAKDVTPGMVAVSEDTRCFMCDVGPGTTEEHADGNGVCEIAAGCKGTDAMNSWEKAQDRSRRDLTFPQMDLMEKVSNPDSKKQDLPDTFFLWYEMTVYCYSQDESVVDSKITSGCLSDTYVQDIIKTFVDEDLDDPYELAVVATSVVHAAVADFLPKEDQAYQRLAEAVQPAWNPDCQGWSKYDLQFTTRESDMNTNLQKMFDAVVESPGDMSITIIDNWDPKEDIQPCKVALVKKNSIKYPSINNMPAFFPSRRGNLGPDVVVADGDSIVATESIEPGKTYKIYAQNFPRGTTVQLNLMSADGEPMEVASIPNFNDADVNAVEWTAPLDLDEDTRYYVKGTPAAFPRLFGNSQLLRSRLFKNKA
jgi:hypothetical protein